LAIRRLDAAISPSSSSSSVITVTSSRMLATQWHCPLASTTMQVGLAPSWSKASQRPLCGSATGGDVHGAVVAQRALVGADIFCRHRTATSGHTQHAREVVNLLLVKTDTPPTSEGVYRETPAGSPVR